MSQPTVSLLVPIYNVEKYLRECLDSVASQTLTDIDVICINDGSKDSSRDIIQEYLDKDSRFRVIDKENSGYGISMNMGLEAATGKYVGILESDDFFEPNALELLVNAAEKYEADVAKANFWFYWSTPEARNELFELVTPDMANRLYDTSKEYQLFYRKNSIWSAIYKRDFLNSNNIRFVESPGASYQDAAFDFKVWACAERVILLDTPILHYRQDNEASSVNSPSKVYCICDEYAEMDKFIEAHPEKTYLKAVEEYMKYDSYMWNYDRLTKPLAAEFINKFSEEFKRDRDAGYVNMDMFEWWKKEDMDLIIRDPQLFHQWRVARAEGNVFQHSIAHIKAKGWKSFWAGVKNRLSSN